MKSQARLLEKYMHSAPLGRVEWIGLRPAKREPVVSVDRAMAIAGAGLDGDHKGLKASGSSRQVTLINAEDVSALSRLMRFEEDLDPALLRRNIVVSGLNLTAFRYQRLRIGEAIVEIRAHCHPCLRMERTLGAGAVLAMYGHAGYCAVIEQSGLICVGDEVQRIGQEGLALS